MEFEKNVLVDIQHDAEIAQHDTAIAAWRPSIAAPPRLRD
jgi:hypothetical protein